MIYRKMVRSERRDYEGPIMSNNPSVVMYLATQDSHGDSLIGLKLPAYEALGEPEYLHVTIESAGPEPWLVPGADIAAE